MKPKHFGNQADAHAREDYLGLTGFDPKCEKCGCELPDDLMIAIDATDGQEKLMCVECVEKQGGHGFVYASSESTVLTALVGSSNQDPMRHDRRKVSDNPLGHQYGLQKWNGYAVCEWCNAVEGTSNGAKKCPMAYTVADRPNDWVRKSKFGGHSRGYGPFSSGSKYFEYPDPEKLEIKEREYDYYQYNLKEIKMAEQIMQFFDAEHLSDDLKGVSLPFCHLAETIVEVLPQCAERTVALRKLLEAKDAAVRAKLIGMKTSPLGSPFGFTEEE